MSTKEEALLNKLLQQAEQERSSPTVAYIAFGSFMSTKLRVIQGNPDYSSPNIRKIIHDSLVGSMNGVNGIYKKGSDHLTAWTAEAIKDFYH